MIYLTFPSNKNMSPISFLLIYIFVPIITASVNCSPTCGIHPICFPFRLKESSSNCGYPGFNLACKSPENQTLILSLPHSGDFLVREIDYTAQSIQVYDSGNCLPKRLLVGLNLSGSPFMADFPANYTLFSCPKQFQGMGFPTIACLGNSTRSVVAINLNGSFVVSMVSTRCQKMDSMGFLMGDVLKMRWVVPRCQDCEGNGGICGLDDQKQIVCNYSNPDDGSTKASNNDQTFKIIALSISMPVMACCVGIGIFLHILDNRNRARQAVENPPTTIEGLDQATIDSYTKVVLGESKRVPGPNKEICPICLSDFTPHEILRCIPQCQHSFHVDCIDEWLRIKGTCPLCRESHSVQESS